MQSKGTSAVSDSSHVQGAATISEFSASTIPVKTVRIGQELQQKLHIVYC